MSGMKVLTLEDMRQFYEQCEREEQLQGEPQSGGDDAGGEDRET